MHLEMSLTAILARRSREIALERQILACAHPVFTSLLLLAEEFCHD